MNREKKLIKNTFILSIGTLMPQIFSLITLPILTAILSKTEYGTYDLALTFASVLVPLATVQIQQAAFRFLIENRTREGISSIVTNVYIFTLPVSLIACGIIFFFLKDINILSKILLCFYLFLQILLDVTRQVVRGIGNNKIYSISAIINSFVNVIGVIILLSCLNFGFNGLFISLDFALTISLIYLIVKLNLINYFSLEEINKKLIVKMLNYSWPMVPNTISLWIVNLSDRLIVTMFLGIEANAVYAIANKIPKLFTIAYGTFNLAWQESASMTIDDNDVDKYYSTIFDQLFCFLSGAMALLIAVMPVLFAVLIRGEYIEAYYQMPLLFMGVFFSCFSSYYGSIYIALKKTKNVGISSLIGALINIMLNLVFIKKFGLYAVSISTVISYFVLVVYRMLDTQKYRRITYNKFKIVLCLFVLVIMNVLSYHKTPFFSIINGIIALGFSFWINRKMINNILVALKNKQIVKKSNIDVTIKKAIGK
ncbi:MAG: lipopolysaccharide biosynthesis protein [Aminipila sp.]